VGNRPQNQLKGRDQALNHEFHWSCYFVASRRKLDPVKTIIATSTTDSKAEMCHPLVNAVDTARGYFSSSQVHSLINFRVQCQRCSIRWCCRCRARHLREAAELSSSDEPLRCKSGVNQQGCIPARTFSGVNEVYINRRWVPARTLSGVKQV
jgi:hypothetical protein